MQERDFRIDIVQGYINIQRIRREGEPTKYLLLLVSAMVCIFGIAPHARSALKTAADVILAVSVLIFAVLMIVVMPSNRIHATRDPTYEQLTAKVRSEEHRSHIRHRFLQLAAVFFMLGMTCAMISASGL